MADFTHVTIIDYDTVFRGAAVDGPETIKNSVFLLNSTVAFEIIARLNYTARFVKTTNYHQEIADWFGKEHPDIISKYDKLITDAYADDPKVGHLKLVNLWSNLKLLEAILEEGAHNKPPADFDHGQATEQLLLAYLVINGFLLHGQMLSRLPSPVP